MYLSKLSKGICKSAKHQKKKLKKNLKNGKQEWKQGMCQYGCSFKEIENSNEDKVKNYVYILFLNSYRTQFDILFWPLQIC